MNELKIGWKKWNFLRNLKIFVLSFLVQNLLQFLTQLLDSGFRDTKVNNSSSAIFCVRCLATQQLLSCCCLVVLLTLVAIEDVKKK